MPKSSFRDSAKMRSTIWRPALCVAEWLLLAFGQYTFYIAAMSTEGESSVGIKHALENDATAETSNKRIKSEPQTKGKEPATENDKGKEIEVGGDDDGEEVKDLKEKEREELANKIIKETPDMVSPSDKARKRKVAVLLAYRGAGYSGMQRNPGVKTIEEELEIAIFKAGGLTRANFGTPTKIDWMRCARTDKGVSAIGNVVSLKLLLDPPTPVESAALINKFLPPSVRILAIHRVNNAFNSKKACDGRSYEYVVPTYAFAARNSKEGFKFTEETRNRVNEILKMYLGTHNYHNYTIGKSPNSESAKRFMVSFKCGPAIELDGVEIVVLSVVGQSFMLHQIRKMVGTVIAIMRCGFFDKLGDQAMIHIRKIMFESFTRNRYELPVAPSQFLLLDKCLYAFWNKKFAATHGSMDFDEADELKENFKKYIYASIIQQEKEEDIMKNWVVNMCDLNNIDFRSLIARAETPVPTPATTPTTTKTTPEITPITTPVPEATTTTTTTTTTATAVTDAQNAV